MKQTYFDLLFILAIVSFTLVLYIMPDPVEARGFHQHSSHHYHFRLK